MKTDGGAFGRIPCGMSGCRKRTTGKCEYCGLPLCEEHARTIEDNREEWYCRECFLFIAVSGRAERHLARKVIPRVLVVEPGKCTGCRTCQLICSFRFQGIYSYSEGAIRIQKNEPICLNIPVLCEHCADPECVRVCPTEGLRKDRETGMVIVQSEECVGCMECVEACPFGAIFPRPGGQGVALCDLCRGDPQCAVWCEPKAIEWVNKFEVGERKKLVLVRRVPTGSPH